MTRTFLQSTVLFLLVMGLAFVVQASGSEAGGGEQTSGKNPDAGMTLQGEMIMLGNAVQDGVRAMAHLKDVEKAMVDLGGKATHHLMVVFVDQKSGDLIEPNAAAVKFSYENQQPGDPAPLTAMQGHYGADLALQGPGEYQFVIGSQFAEGRKRQFLFDFTLR